MKKKIKTWLIHLLGGITVRESFESDKNSAYLGAYTALSIIKGYAESLNGKPADEWSRIIGLSYKTFKSRYYTQHLSAYEAIFLPVKRGIRNTQKHCIPYEHTAHLLGTSEAYTEGGSE